MGLILSVIVYSPFENENIINVEICKVRIIGCIFQLITARLSLSRFLMK